MDWIRAKDKMPCKYTYCLVYGNDGLPLISIARHNGIEWEMLSNDPQSNAVACVDLTWYMEPTEITHWIQLPEEPKS